MAIRVVCMDFHGTVAAYGRKGRGIDYNLPPPNGLRELFDYCKKRNIRIVSTSDSSISKLKKDMSLLFSLHNCSKLTIEDYFDFFCLDEWPKDFSRVAKSYCISPFEILVVGDGPKDMEGARKYGCNYFLVPEYRAKKDHYFDFREIKIEEFNLEELERLQGLDRSNEV